jgi:hypothetical protein
MTNQPTSTNPIAFQDVSAELDEASRMADLTGDEAPFEQLSDRRWADEDDVLQHGELADKIRVLARRAADHHDVTADLVKIAAGL